MNIYIFLVGTGCIEAKLQAGNAVVFYNPPKINDFNIKLTAASPDKITCPFLNNQSDFSKQVDFDRFQIDPKMIKKVLNEPIVVS